MNHSVRRHLRLEIESYDQSIRKFIPGYEAGLFRAAEEIARARPRKVLDLGAGTGALSEFILAQSDTAVAELLDVDAEMLAVARARLKRFGNRARFRQASFLDPLPACDAAAASLALHHVPLMADKTRLYERIREALAPGGVFVNADVTMPASGARRDADYARWAAHLEACGIGSARAYEHFEEWAGEDTYFPLDDELRAMCSAGFEARCAWREPPNTLLVGQRPR
ncbi:MAG: class I SAM-dependent methyltransferase [Gammaproteobacteria bacterium]|nr:class I SAM-dependent methyltransferase [Gammaproteobacteria bacterium]